MVPPLSDYTGKWAGSSPRGRRVGLVFLVSFSLATDLWDSCVKGPEGEYNPCMGVVDDVRKLLQDLVTPEMRSLATEMKAFREDMNHRFDEVNRRFDYIERSFRLDERIAAVEDQIRKPSKRQESH